MGYYNPILAFGLDKFSSRRARLVWMGSSFPICLRRKQRNSRPPRHCRVTSDADLPLISMLAPTTPSDRMEMIAAPAQGFIYLVSVTGVTGLRNDMPDGLAGSGCTCASDTLPCPCVWVSVSGLRSRQKPWAPWQMESSSVRRVSVDWRKPCSRSGGKGIRQRCYQDALMTLEIPS